MPYVELHARSAFSFLRGGSSPDDLAARAAELGLPAVALTDRDGVYGAPRFYAAARDQGHRAIVGAELTMEDDSVVPLLVANRTGYENLCQLISTCKLGDNRGPAAESRKRPCHAPWDLLARHSEGLIALTGDAEGPLLRAWEDGGAAAASAALVPLERIFGPGRLYVELQRHLVRGEEQRLRLLHDLAAAHRLPVLATNGVTCATPGDRIVTDAFTCLRNHTTLDAAGRLLAPNAESHLKPARAMAGLFRDMPEAIANTQTLAERLEFTLRDLGYRFPDFPVPGGTTMDSHLREVTYAGARERFPAVDSRVRTQLDRELALIAKLGFSGYFLIVWDICRYARGQGILVQGRGSAANSAVCFALRITAVDPIRQRLLFERFLSEARVGADGHPSWPDIDLDLPSGDLRERVIQEVYRRHGPRGAGMTANVITYRGRSAVREAGKVLGLPADILDRFSGLHAAGDFPETLAFDDQLAMAGLDASHPRLPALVRLVDRMRGLPRHLGQHSGGIVICGGMLDRVVPLENASMPGRVVVQWDKDDCEDLGIVKIDFLGLGMMAVLQDTFELTRRRGRGVELHTIPQDDPATFELMQRADTIGVFQIESRAQMATLPRFKPREFYDVAMQVAIIRPGPIVGKLVHPIIRRRQGLEPVSYFHPSVDSLVRPILERTYGVVLFQEQMLQLAMVLADFSGAEAEDLRRSLGFTRPTERLERALRKLREAMARRGHPPELVSQLLDAAKSFSLYGFPESHSISFALLAYASSWLKVHRLAEFTASLLNNQPMGFYSPASLVQDARRHGLRVRPVSIAESAWRCTVEADDAIRLGFNYVNGVRETALREMLAARDERPFESMPDFLRRTRLNASERRALARVGALQPLAPHRRAALWSVEEPIYSRDLLNGAGGGDQGPETRDRRSAATNRGEEASLVPFTIPCPLPAMNPAERLRADFEGLGLTAGDHPMRLVRPRLPHLWRAADLASGRDGQRVRIGGSVTCRQRPGTAKGVLFVSIEDETGIANAIVTAELFERERLLLTQEHALVIGGRLQNREGVIHVYAEEIAALSIPDLPSQASHDFR